MHDTPHPTPLAQHNSLHITLLSLGQSQPHHAYTIQRMPLARDDQSRIRARSRVGIVEALLSKKLVILCGNKSLPIEAFVRQDDIRGGWHGSSARYVEARGFLIPGNPFSSILTDFPEEVEKITTGQQSSLKAG